MTAGKSRVCSLGMFSLGIGLAAVLLAPREAFALQPLSDFVRSARTRNFDAREQAAVVAQRHERGKPGMAEARSRRDRFRVLHAQRVPSGRDDPHRQPRSGPNGVGHDHGAEPARRDVLRHVSHRGHRRLGANRGRTPDRNCRESAGERDGSSTCSEPSRRPTSRWWRRKPSFGPRTSDVTLPRRTSTSSGHVPPPASRRKLDLKRATARLRQVDQVLRHSLFTQGAADHILVATGAGQSAF